MKREESRRRSSRVGQRPSKEEDGSNQGFFFPFFSFDLFLLFFRLLPSFFFNGRRREEEGTLQNAIAEDEILSQKEGGKCRLASPLFFVRGDKFFLFGCLTLSPP